MITQLLNIRYPILQGSMAHISTHQLVAAVSGAGGLGVLTTAGFDEKQLAKQIQEVRSRTDKPFGIHLMLQEKNFEALLTLAIQAKPACLVLSGKQLAIYIPWIREAGIKVLGLAYTVEQALEAQTAGADAVIVEGNEAGGHLGPTSLLTLLPQVVQTVEIPVIAAGGIASGPGLVAVLALGACGIQMGTAFLVAEECPVPLTIKQAIVRADDTGTIVTGRKKGVPVRSLKNDLLLRYQQMEYAGVSVEELEQLTKGSLWRAFVAGEIETGSVMAGEAAGLIKEIAPAQVIMETIMAEAKHTLHQLDSCREENFI